VFNLTGSEIVVILLLALVVLGPEKLPDAIRRFGRTYAELKKLGTGFQDEFRTAIDQPMREMRETTDMLRRSVDFSGDSVQDRPPRADDLRAPDDPPPVGPGEPGGPSEHLPFVADTEVSDVVPHDDFGPFGDPAGPVGPVSTDAGADADAPSADGTDTGDGRP
jgi:sec-independent protein translocase protein TatB